MALIESLKFLVTADTANATTNLTKVGTTASTSLSYVEKLKAGIGQGVGIGAGVGLASGLTSGLKELGEAIFSQMSQAVDAASNLEQAGLGVKAVFGDASGVVRDFGADAATSVGLSSRAFDQETTVVGELLQNLGLTQKASADASIELTKIGADLSAAFGGSSADAVDKLTKALGGQTRGLVTLGLRIKSTDVDQRVLKLGLDTSTAAAEAQSRSLATLSLIREQASGVAGTFAAKEDTLAGQQARMQAKLEDARAELGQQFLPLMVQFTETVNDAIPVVVAFGNGIEAAGNKAKQAALPFEVAAKAAHKWLDLPWFQVFGEVSGDAKNLAVVIENNVGHAFTEGLVASGNLGISTLKELEAQFGTLEDATKGLGSVGDSLFGVARKTEALFKAASPGDSAQNSAKAYATALRQVDDSTRSVADAQRDLQDAEMAHFLTTLGASSDDVSEAQIAERESTRSLANAKLTLIDAQQKLNDLQSGGAAASRLEAQAAVLDAQKALKEANGSGDVSAIDKAKAAAIRAQQQLNQTSSASQANQLAKAQSDVEAATDGVTQAAIDQRKAQRDLNDTLLRGHDGSKELRDADRELEDAQRRVEDATRALDDAQDGLVSGLGATAGAAKNAGDRFYDTVDAADALIQDLITKKKTPDEFAAAIHNIELALGGVATVAVKRDELKAYNDELERLITNYTMTGGFGSKVASGLFPKGGITTATSTANAAEQRLTINQSIYLDGKQILGAVLDANTAAGSPIVTTVGR